MLVQAGERKKKPQKRARPDMLLWVAIVGGVISFILVWLLTPGWERETHSLVSVVFACTQAWALGANDVANAVTALT